ncbi:hypothetical protein Lal_00021907 [Lupinus albus]|nr:hypothetical protein Lal_00021907 [Lupinus albus]
MKTHFCKATESMESNEVAACDLSNHSLSRSTVLKSDCGSLSASNNLKLTHSSSLEVESSLENFSKTNCPLRMLFSYGESLYRMEIFGALFVTSFATLLEPKLATSLEPKLTTSLEPKLATSLEPKLATSLESKLATSLEPKLATLLEPKSLTNHGRLKMSFLFIDTPSIHKQ